MPSSETQFKKGNGGNGGRAKGSRNKLSKAFIKTLANDFKAHGKSVVEDVRISKPEAYLNVIGRLMPKLMELSGPDGSDIPVSGTVKHVKSST